MLTNNFIILRKLQACGLGGKSGLVSSNFSSFLGSLKDNTGALVTSIDDTDAKPLATQLFQKVYTSALARSQANYPSEPQKSYGMSITVGSGTTAPTQTDYKLDTELTASNYFSAVAIAESRTMTSDGVQITYSVSGTAKATGTISEVGVWFYPLYISNKYFLVSRDVLANPISFVSGDHVNFDITFALDWE